MSVKTSETVTPQATEPVSDDGWVAEEDIPQSERSQSKSDAMRELLRSAPLDSKGNRKWRKVASATPDAANVYSTLNGTDYHVMTRKVGRTMVTLQRGNRAGTTIERDTFDVYARFEPGFAPRAKSNGNGSK